MHDGLSRLIAGCMTGTSLDGLDAALVEIQGTGLAMRPRFLGMTSLDFGPLRHDLARLTHGSPQPAITFMKAARKLGELHAQAVTLLCANHLPAGSSLAMVAAHGQTIWHAPSQAMSWQLMDPWPIVRQLRVPVVYDLRQADLVARGQGAPITPLADWVMYRDQLQLRLIANLGGVCNVTDLPADSLPEAITGGDIGPCNLLIDGLVHRLYPGLSYDQDGRLAASGMVHPEFGQWVQAAPFFNRPLPHSTGREDFNDAWLDGLLRQAKSKGWANQDIIASAVDAVAYIITRHCQSLAGNRHLILAGGGAHNQFLVERIRCRLDTDDRLSLSDELGIPVSGREAMAFAILGALSQDGAPITLPAITGSANPGRAGVWAYP